MTVVCGCLIRLALFFVGRLGGSRAALFSSGEGLMIGFGFYFAISVVYVCICLGGLLKR